MHKQNIPCARFRSLSAVALLALVSAAATKAGAAPPSIVDLMHMLQSRVANAPASSPQGPFLDMGKVAGSASLQLTIYLKPRQADTLADYVRAVQTPGNADFHVFLSTSQFIERFAPTQAAITRVQTKLGASGLETDQLFGNELALRVQGTVAAAEAVFGLDLHLMRNKDGTATGYASSTELRIPQDLAADIRGVGGFDTILPSSPGPTKTQPSSTIGTLTNVALNPGFAAQHAITSVPGSLLPSDFEKLYDAAPLVQAGATGAGRTIGIITENNFDTAAPYVFWQKLGISVASNHLAAVFVDGAEGKAIASNEESYLDTEQSGAIAPAASVVAYVTQGGPAGLIDGYEEVASQNVADVVSSSFGTPEVYFQSNAAQLFNRTLLPALNDVLSEMAVQGQTVFVASGDAGAFDVNRNEAGYYQVFTGVGSPPSYTPLYTVNGIAASPLVTACGGTTLPFTATAQSISPSFTVTVPQEQPWTSSRLPLQALQQTGSTTEALQLIEAVFPAGSGGGVSAIEPVPAYQTWLAGVRITQPNQALVALNEKLQIIATEPANFAGRNLPDISADADPHTGYLYYQDSAFQNGGGGTSIVAPQMAGTMALIDQMLGHRVGQLNPLLYRLQATGASPATDITTGDNWGYAAHPGFDQTTGLGTINAELLYLGLRSFD